MAHKQGGVVIFLSYFGILRACINTEQDFVCARGHQALID